jgi:hypothetical protein
MKYSLKANVKRLTGPPHPDRDGQFQYIEAQRKAFLAAGLPVISIDTKKKELIGNFENGGRTWCHQADGVNVHDFRQDALGRSVPYGIYNLNHNRGYVYVGNSADTPQFSVDALASWWIGEGQGDFPEADKSWYWPMPWAATGTVVVAGSNSFKNNWPIGWDWKWW